MNYNCVKFIYLVWGSNYYASILVNGRLNISDPKEYGLFKQMLHEFETLPHSRGIILMDHKIFPKNAI